jgi:hypothetical protein
MAVLVSIVDRCSKCGTIRDEWDPSQAGQIYICAGCVAYAQYLARNPDLDDVTRVVLVRNAAPR